MVRTDVLVIGSGIAGLSFAAKVAQRFPAMEITVITKDKFSESNTRYAQGGIAVALDSVKDSFQQHIEDTLLAGDGLCDRKVVESVVHEGPDRLRELMDWGAQFDRDATGHLALGREGGHTAHRIIHYKDATGFQIAEALQLYLTTLPNVKLLSHHFAVDLLTEKDYSSANKKCLGAEVIDLKSRNIKTFLSRITLLATGGAGQVYATTTNPLIATGDGIAMAHRAGAKVYGMEFIQFHPTAFYSVSDNPSFLISEAVRGFGAYLRSYAGERFVLNYDNRGELASRDIVSKAIYNQLCDDKKENVLLDCRHLPADELKKHFPTIYHQCLQKGIDITQQQIPVAPAAHYLCGGIAVDLHGKSSINHLYACGECSYTGLHGANRLASNSLLEALVYSHRIFVHLESMLQAIEVPVGLMISKNAHTLFPDAEKEIADLRRQLRECMSQHAGIVRTHAGLSTAKEKLTHLSEAVEHHYITTGPSPQLCELRNLLDVASLIILQSQQRTENRGTYYNADLR